MQKLINAISEMNSEKLKELLPNKQYSSVSKNYFIDCLEATFNKFKEKGYSEFHSVVHGYCEYCHKDNNYKGYSFLTSDNKFLDLTFFIEENNICDIFNCGHLIPFDSTKKNYDDAEGLTLKISIEEDYNFTYPSSSIKKESQGLKILSSLEKYHNNITDLDNLFVYHQNLNDFYDTVTTYERVNFKKLFNKFTKLVFNLNELFELKQNIITSKQAMIEYNNLNLLDEKSIVEWILKYYKYEPDFYQSNKRFYKYLFKLSDREYNIIVDCSSYKETYQFSENYWKHNGELFEKYRPMESELHKITNHELPYYLKYHNMYNKILEKYFF